MSNDTREAVAGVQHEIWSHWMRYLFNMARHNSDGSVTIPAELVSRWTRQVDTNYADLTEREQESDRHQADKVLLDSLAELDPPPAMLATHTQIAYALQSCAFGLSIEATEDTDAMLLLDCQRAIKDARTEAARYAATVGGLPVSVSP